MDSGWADLTRDIVAIILMVAGAVLCVTLTIGLVKVIPTLRRSALNFEKVTASAVEAAPNIVDATANIKETTGYLRDAAKDVAQATPVLQLLGPAGAAANLASTGVGRIAGFIRGLFRR